MWIKSLRFVSLLFTALALGAAMAHLLELPKKIKLSAEDYLIVQQIYRGWALLGIVATDKQYGGGWTYLFEQDISNPELNR
jgi:hypothetical protein